MYIHFSQPGSPSLCSWYCGEKKGVAIIRHLALWGTGCHLNHLISCRKLFLLSKWVGINQWKHDSDLGEFIIDVMFLFIGPIKPDWLADCSPDKTPFSQPSSSLAEAAWIPAGPKAAGILTEMALEGVTRADIRLLDTESFLAVSIADRFTYLQADSIICILRLQPSKSISLISEGHDVIKCSCVSEFLSLRTVGIWIWSGLVVGSSLREC